MRRKNGLFVYENGNKKQQQQQQQHGEKKNSKSISTKWQRLNHYLQMVKLFLCK